MKICADTHVHVYPGYDAGALLASAASALKRAAPQAGVRILCLTESSGHRVWAGWAADPQVLAAAGWAWRALSGSGAAEVVHSEHGALWLFAGRQIVTAERLEVLALTCAEEVPDGLSALETIAAVQAVEALPVLSWSPGKWFGARGRLVGQLIENALPGQLFVGDILLRPPLWTEPRLMKQARAKGVRCLVGTDPLPPVGEERVCGRYGVAFESGFDGDRPIESFRAALRNPDQAVSVIGARNGVAEAVRRYVRAQLQR
jgi:hypothetical protein